MSGALLETISSNSSLRYARNILAHSHTQTYIHIYSHMCACLRVNKVPLREEILAHAALFPFLFLFVPSLSANITHIYIYMYICWIISTIVECGLMVWGSGIRSCCKLRKCYIAVGTGRQKCRASWWAHSIGTSLCASVHSHTHSCTPTGLYVRVPHIFLAILYHAHAYTTYMFMFA